MKSCFRVNYYLGGQPASAFVVAEADSQAADFLGVTDGSAQVSVVAKPVEVAGVDKAHAPIPPTVPFTAPPEPPQVVSRDEFNTLQAQLAELKQQLAVAPSVKPVK